LSMTSVARPAWRRLRTHLSPWVGGPFRGAPRPATRVGGRCILSYPTCILRNMSQPSAHRHHAIDYVELTVTDLEQAKRFYSEAFGWGFNDYGPEYAGIQSPQGGSAPEVGGLSKGQQVRAGGPFVLLYSADLNQSVEAVKDAGGQGGNGPYAFPGGRRFHFTDPSGNELGVWAETERAGRLQGGWDEK